jgi:glycosyltransferase involved in cell wall biosynthesis
MNNKKNISIVVLTYNALEYVKLCIESLTNTSDVEYNVVVVDNASDEDTKNFLHESMLSNKIDVLCNLESNRLFSKGNNVGVKISPEESNYVLLLNSDVEILDPMWLKRLLDVHKEGITTYGACVGDQFPNRGDGYCFLIDRKLYERYWLDELFPWWWGITKLQAEVLSGGYSVQAISDHKNIIKHYGGSSGDTFKKIKNSTKIDLQQVKSWFGKNEVEIL